MIGVAMPTKASDGLLGRCYVLWQARAWDDMLRVAQLAVRAHRRSSYAWQQLAIAHYQLKHHQKAVTAGRKAIEIDPTNAFAMCSLALAERRLGDPRWVKTMARTLELHRGLALNRDVARALADPAYRGVGSRKAKAGAKAKRGAKSKGTAAGRKRAGRRR